MRPVCLKREENISGHGFPRFFALVLRKELESDPTTRIAFYPVSEIRGFSPSQITVTALWGDPG
jgi:hypothetical protein